MEKPIKMEVLGGGPIFRKHPYVVNKIRYLIDSPIVAMYFLSEFEAKTIIKKRRQTTLTQAAKKAYRWLFEGCV